MSPSLDPPAGHSMKSRTFLPLSTCTITRVSSSHTVTVCWRLYTRSFRGQTQVIQRSTYCIGESHHKITIGSKSCLHQIDSCTYKMRCVAEQHEYSPFSVACWNNSPSSSSSPPAYHIPTPHTRCCTAPCSAALPSSYEQEKTEKLGMALFWILGIIHM